MSQRTTRINQLLLREFSEELHSRWRNESVRITLTSFSISDDLRTAHLGYSVIGDAGDRHLASQLLRRILKPLITEVFHRVKIKYTPEIRLFYDDAPERGVHLINIMDTVAREDAARAERHAATPPPPVTDIASEPVSSPPSAQPPPPQ